MAQDILVNVGSDVEEPTHELSLEGLGKVIGLRLPRGFGQGGDVDMLNLRPQTLSATASEGEYGPHGAMLTEIEQSEWHSGRGVENLADDKMGFYDSHMLYSMLAGQLTAAPQFNFAEGLRDEDRYLPDHYNIDWLALLEANRYISILFTAGQNYNADKAYIWLRKVGTPGNEVTLELCANNGGVPGAAAKTITVDGDDVTDEISIWQVFDWTGTTALVGTTVYHLKIYGHADDDENNHWEIGVDYRAAEAQISDDNTNWEVAGFKPYYRVVDADVGRYFRLFEFRGRVYAADIRADGSATHLYGNGDRGMVDDTVGSDQGADNLVDEAKSWVVDEYAGAKVRTVSGTGMGQVRDIDSNTADHLSISPDWDITPDTTTEYVIFYTNKFIDISPAAGAQFDVPITDIEVNNDQVLFARGTGNVIFCMHYNSATPGYEFADDAGSDEADLLQMYAGQLIKVNNDQENNDVVAAVGKIKDFGDNIKFSKSDMAVGDSHYPVRKLVEHGGTIYAIKDDGIYALEGNAFNQRASTLKYVVDENNGEAAISFNQMLYFSYGGFSMFRLLGEQMDDVGPWQRAGLPEERKGKIACLAGLPSMIVCALDAGDDGVSSVLAYDKGGFHELLRAWETGARIREVFTQSIGNGGSWIWTNVGDDLTYQKMPKHGYNPTHDSTYQHHHEAVLISAAVNLKAAQLKKLFKELTVITENLGSGRELEVSYQVDDKVGTNEWTPAGVLVTSPEDSAILERGGIRKIRWRIRALTNRALNGLTILATVLQGWTRLPDKDQWAVRARIGTVTRQEGEDYEAQYVWDSLREMSKSAAHLKMRAIVPWMDDRVVKLDAVRLNPRSYTEDGGKRWSADVYLTIIEA